jgi:hypothetical protein
MNNLQVAGKIVDAQTALYMDGGGFRSDQISVICNILDENYPDPTSKLRNTSKSPCPKDKA